MCSPSHAILLFTLYSSSQPEISRFIGHHNWNLATHAGKDFSEDEIQHIHLAKDAQVLSIAGIEAFCPLSRGVFKKRN